MRFKIFELSYLVACFTWTTSCEISKGFEISGITNLKIPCPVLGNVLPATSCVNVCHPPGPVHLQMKSFFYESLPEVHKSAYIRFHCNTGSLHAFVSAFLFRRLTVRRPINPVFDTDRSLSLKLKISQLTFVVTAHLRWRLERSTLRLTLHCSTRWHAWMMLTRREIVFLVFFSFLMLWPHNVFLPENCKFKKC